MSNGEAAPEVLAKVFQLRGVRARHGAPISATALQFPLGHSAAAGVLVGCRSVTELNQHIDACELEIPDEMWGELRGAGLIPAEAPTPAAAKSRVDA